MPGVMVIPCASGVASTSGRAVCCTAIGQRPMISGRVPRAWTLGRPSHGAHGRPTHPVVPMANIFTDAWGVNNAEELQTLTQAVSANLFAFSIFPYAAFLYYLTKSKQAPPLMLFGWYFLLVFVGATIPAGIYAKTHYGTTLANVDWLHGSAEVMLTFTNLFIVLGTRQGIRKIQAEKQQAAGLAKDVQQQVVGVED